jgi:hypothetical protein
VECEITSSHLVSKGLTCCQLVWVGEKRKRGPASDPVVGMNASKILGCKYSPNF